MPKKAKPSVKFYSALGRRKTATARARLYLSTQEVLIKDQKLKKGEIYVNNISIEKYFPDPFAKAKYTKVFQITNTQNHFITTVLVEGSGKTGQLDAMVLAIARAICIYDPKLKTILRANGFITRDSRARQRETPGLMGARKQKQSPKR